MKTYVTTITDYHLKQPLQMGNHTYGILQAMGKIYPMDIGKRIYVENGIYTVENNQQRNERLNPNEQL